MSDSSSISTATPNPPDQKPFWKIKTLWQMTASEWESLCDGCGRCCLHKIEDPYGQSAHYTNVACRLLDAKTCQCSDYENRREYVPDCIKLTADAVGRFYWLPKTCAYRLLAECQDLPSWHPLITKDPDSVHKANISVKGRVIPEYKAGALSHHLVDWFD
jgi:uncharacterized protein